MLFYFWYSWEFHVLFDFYKLPHEHQVTTEIINLPRTPYPSTRKVELQLFQEESPNVKG